MKIAWQNINNSITSIGFLASTLRAGFPVSSGIPGLGLFGLCAGEKNGLWSLRSGPSYLLRPEDPKGPGSVLRGYAHLPGRGDPPGLLSKVPEGETREAGVAGRQSFLHQAICLLRRPSVSGLECSGCCQRTSPGLEDGQGPGEAIHAGAVAASGNPGPKVIGIDEVSIRKGHTYRIVVSDLERKRPIWFGGEDRSEESMDLFFESLGQKKSQRIRLAVMDMWKAFLNSTRKHAPQAAILFDKFHVMRHLNEALDKVRKSEYARLSGKDRRFIKGQKYTLLSRRENLSTDGRVALKTLLKANKRLNTAYLLKESFGQLWEYKKEGWARKFFDNWRSSLKWQRLKPYEEFAEMIESHWDGIAAFIQSEDKVSLGFVEGLNNKIRVIQRRAYGLRDEEYLRLKVLNLHVTGDLNC